MSLKLEKKVGSSSISKEILQDKKHILKEQFPHLSDIGLGYSCGRMINKLHTKIVKALEYRKVGLLNYIEAQ
jgi:hypothetical protein